MRVPDYAAPRIQIDFTAEYFAAAKAVEYDHARDERFENATLKLRNVTEVCVNHCCWITLECDAKTWRGVAREVTDTRAKLLRLIKRYYR